MKSFADLFPRDEQWDMPNWKSLVGHLSPANEFEVCCTAVDPEIGFLCVLPAGHEGIHVSCGGDEEDGGVYAVWSDRDSEGIIYPEES